MQGLGSGETKQGRTWQRLPTHAAQVHPATASPCLHRRRSHCPLMPRTGRRTHLLRMKNIIIAISRLMARYLVACTLALSYTLMATRRLPSLGHVAV